MAGHEHVFDARHAWFLDIIFRKLIQDPRRILKDHIHAGMSVLDVGCGPGYFSIPISKMVGPRGKVIAADIQQGMLDRLLKKLSPAQKRIIHLHKCSGTRIGVSQQVDFALVFYVLHEVSDQEGFLREIHSVLKPGGTALVIEPCFHVTKKEFEQSLSSVGKTGFTRMKGPS